MRWEEFMVSHAGLQLRACTAAANLCAYKYMLVHFLDILNNPNQLVILIKNIITSSIQLHHHLSHPAAAVLVRQAVSISQIIVGAPTRWTRAY